MRAARLNVSAPPARVCSPLAMLCDWSVTDYSITHRHRMAAHYQVMPAWHCTLCAQPRRFFCARSEADRHPRVRRNNSVNISKLQFIIQTPPACPVCGKPSYSRGGVHPQCAVARADKVRYRKPVKKPKAAGSLWRKRCPACSREVAARRYSCDCGHKFGPTASK